MMNLSIPDVQLPFRFRPATHMDDGELLLFCAANDFLRVEREANGEILVMTPAGGRTSSMNSRITRYLDEWAEHDGRGVAFDSNAGFVLKDGSMRSPDAAWIRKALWEALSEADQQRFAPICPDFVIELRSPSDKLAEVQAKMEMWIANGTQVAWLIDPERKVVEIYCPGDSPEVLHEPSSVQGTGPVAGFELVMARVWE